MSRPLPVDTERVGRVLLVGIEPPTDAWAALQVRQGLMQALALLQSDSALDAAVLWAAGTAWSVGGDADDARPALPEVIAAIESCAKPVVAALHGTLWAGDWELALACDGRIAAPGARMGLNAVAQGMLPGAGGSQRLPRRVGVLKALELMASSTLLTAAQAQALQLVDVVEEGDPCQAAIAHALGLQGRKQRLRDEVAAPVEPALWNALAKELLRKGKQRPAVAAAIDAVQWSVQVPFDVALARERALAADLRAAPEAQALRHQSQAEQATTQLPAELNLTPRAMDALAIIGAGTMGTGIAIAALDAGLQVLLLEQDPAALARGLARVQQFYTDRVTAGKLAHEQASARQAALRGTLQWQDLGSVDLVIEAVFEDLAVKQKVFRKIDQHAAPGAVLATNTSYLDVDAIARATQRPQDVIGLHFFSPANVMKLLEVVRGTDTAADVIATGMALGKRLNKLPVLCGNAFGFIGNRIYNAYRKQVEFMLEEGALPQEVDAALQQFGFAMGPFAVADLSGLDIAWRMRQSQAATRDPQARYVNILDQLCERGRLGRKTGAGYYTYVDGKKSAAVDAVVTEIIVQSSAQRGLQRRALPPAEIVRRALAAMCNEAALLLAEGVARQPSDIDVALVQGYGFARWAGGPLFWLSQFDAAAQQALQDELAQHTGHGFVRGDLQLLRL